MAAKEESLDSQGAMGKEHDILEGRTSAPLLPIYFDFDKSNIREDQRTRIEKNAAYLKQNMGSRIQIEGNCDERGTVEYNLSLGEKRASAAMDYLKDLGVAPSRMSIISYGKERPAVMGHNEAAWAKNRRDEFKIVSQ